MGNNDGVKLLYILAGVGIGVAFAGVCLARHSAAGKSMQMKEAVNKWEDEGGAPPSIPIAASQ